MGAIRIGTAGWSISSRYREDFPAAGSQLERYAARFGCVEINSSFYRPHRSETYQRWVAAVPEDFKFSVKVPKTITHEKRLRGCESEIDAFCRQVAALGAKLRVLLVQTPPSLRLEPQAAAASFTALRAGTDAAIVVEARHASWFTPEADTLLGAHGVTRVIADPPHGEARPTEASLVYFRFHGRPRVYFSNYDDDALNEIARRLRAAAETSETWCIFDNTAEGHAVANALCVQRLLGPRAVRSR